jgi:putative sigma-54 modulation protein
MEFNVTARNVEINPEIKNYLERKLGNFNRQMESIMETRVEISEEKTRSAQDQFLVRVVINGKGINIYGEERGENILTATDKIAATIKRQIEHQKGKLQEKGGTSIRTETITSSTPDKIPGRIIEVKSMEVKPMSLDEALSQIKILGYEFLLFQNTDNRSVNLLKRRADGNYDLIQSQPE